MKYRFGSKDYEGRYLLNRTEVATLQAMGAPLDDIAAFSRWTAFCVSDPQDRRYLAGKISWASANELLAKDAQ